MTPEQRMAKLSDRERELLALIARGHSNAAICKDLYLSPKTVEAHVRNIFHKLGLTPGGAEHRRVMAVLIFLEAMRPHLRAVPETPEGALVRAA
jgi:DNA-binding NarL/FixJ family response regulator